MDPITLALTVALIIVLSLIFYNKWTEESPNSDQNRKKTIPGLGPEQSRNGLVRINDLSWFLKDLHKQFGPLASFYQDNRYSVSIADPELLKKLRNLENTPTDLFKIFELMVGQNAFGFQELEEIRRRRKLYDNHFMLKGCKSYAKCFVEIANEYIENWRKLGPSDKIPLMETSLDATMKGILRTSYGDHFKNDESRKHFQTLFTEVTKAFEKELKEGSPEEAKVKKDVEEINKTIKEILELREKNPDPDKSLFIDVLLDDSTNGAEGANMGDSIIFINAGFDATGKTIMWAIFEMACQPHIQDKLYNELKTVLGDNHVSLEVLSKLQYLNQVVEEIIRFRLHTLFTARRNKEDVIMGDYVIPAGSNIIQNLGVNMQNEQFFQNANKFDPDHFSPENVKARHAYSWKPFGYAGRRQCPGQSYARTKISFFLAEWCKNFRFKLAPGQVKDVELELGFILRPKEEIWVTLEPRE